MNEKKRILFQIFENEFWSFHTLVAPVVEIIQEFIECLRIFKNFKFKANICGKE